MITLFRKIRRGQISSREFTHYLLYATGEIVLVVIGIIIAFMLDDWHDRRILEKEKRQFIDALINDYALDSMILEDYIERDKEIESQLSRLNERAYQKDANLDTIIYIAKHDYIPQFRYISSYNTTTFRTIEATGKIDLFDQELRAAILRHNQSQNLSIENQKIGAQSIVAKVDEYTNHFKIGGGFPIDDNYLINVSWNIENEREFVILFTEMIGINRMTVENWMNQYQDMLEETETMMNLLREEQRSKKK